MKRYKFSIGLLLIMVFYLAFSACVFAKEVKTDKIAYVNREEKRLVLKFKDFSDTDYTYKVIGMRTGNTYKSGKLKTLKGENKLLVNLGSTYIDNGRYKLVLTSGKNTMTTCFYTGKAIGKPTLSLTEKNGIKASWKLLDNTIYSRYSLILCEGDDSPYTKVDKSTTSAKSTSLTIPVGDLYTLNYKYYMVGIKVLDGITYYGQAYSGKYKYIVAPAKVSGLSAFTNGDQVTLTWNGIRNATSYSVYKSSKKTGTYTLVKSGLNTTTYVMDSVDNNCTTYYKVEATAKLGSTSKKGPLSAPVETKIPLMAGTPSELSFYLNMDEEFCLKWKAGNHADGYKVLYKDLTAGGGYKTLETTETVKVSLESLQASHKYSIKVQSYRLVNKKKVFSDYYSEEFTLVPKTYIKEHEQELLAANVRTIEYIGTTKCVYTTSNYSDKVKTAFVNEMGYSSTTDYLIWISHYTQQTIIYKGSKGKWKIDRSCNCSTGTAATRSPIGVYKITYKEDGWFYTYTKELYVTHWSGRNSFHTRPLNNDGSVNDPTLGKPASHGCSRLLNKDAMYIWKNIPIGTTVVSY